MAATQDKGEGSGSAGRLGTEPALEDLLLSLNIKEEDIGGIFVAKADVESLKEGSKWMAVMRLLSTKPFSAMSLEKTMRFAWAPAQTVMFRAMEGNHFLIHDMPELYRKKHIITDLAEKVGEVITMDMHGGDYVCARVWLDVRKELRRFVAITPEGGKPVVMRVKFEKVPRYCAVCGHIGHVKEECGSGMHPPAAEVFGTWMLADTPWNRAQLHGNSGHAPPQKPQRQETHNPACGRGMGRGGPVLDGGRSGGRGRGADWRGFGGRGRGDRGLGRGGDRIGTSLDSRKRSSAYASLTEVSLVKEASGATAAPLLFTWKEPGVITESGGVSASKKLDFDEEGKVVGYQVPVGTPPPPPSAREQKRPKKHSTPKKDKKAVALASSGEGRRQEQ
ncbi:hypothetical protein QYE76_015423 [Lolium multiflorum]|uniref:Zinc knuckle CX2CX4HX4C domain-containing protein n=1 Tax=Lolium multiflorum TaxID=4521 RepID=A0AAD8U4D1_LOLMU|nr:hypothetical protein QYE76_015423 [Lolium multiflorum]